MDSLLIAAAVPIFFSLIGVELWASRRSGRSLYRFADTVSNLGCGIGQQLFQLLLRGAPFLGYIFLYEHARLFDMPVDALWSWALLFFGVDFAYYWFHRASHRVNALWAAHVVHHQSEEYNLAVALRQSAVQGVFSTPFYFPLAILGFSPFMAIIVGTLNTLYQFWVHTRLVGKLGPLEWILSTPSHHRVHHGINPKYIDRNHGGVFIVWDRLFGTFQEEEEEPTYGTVKPLRSWNPVWANIEPWVNLVRLTRSTDRFADKLKIWWKPPEWRPEDLGGPAVIPEVPRDAQLRYDTPVHRGLVRYALASFVPAVVATTALIATGRKLDIPVVSALSVWIVITLVGLGGLFEGKRWASAVEAARHVALAALAIAIFSPAGPWPIVAAVAALVSVLKIRWLFRLMPVESAVPASPPKSPILR